MTAPPAKSAVSGNPSNSTANAGFAALWDYVTERLGGGVANPSAAEAAAARRQLGVPNSGPLSGLRNLIINGNFSINQRAWVSGAGTTSANQYTLDRWRVVVSGQTISWAALNNGNLVTAPAGGIEQVVEGLSVGGGNYTVNWNGSATCTVNGTARAKGASFALTAGANVTVRFTGGTVGEVMLEPGDVMTGFEVRPAGVELALCQRYYALADAEYKFDAALGSTSVSTGAMWFLPVDMRAVPTVSVLSETGSNAGPLVPTPKSRRGVFGVWEWQNGNTIVARTKAAIVQAVAEL